MRTTNWRTLVGPIATSLVGAGLFLFEHAIGPAPAPGIFLFFAVLCASYIGGAVPGVASAAIAIVAMSALPASSEQFLLISVERGLRLSIFGVVLLATAVLIGTSQDRARRARAQIVAASHDAQVVSAALNNVDFGVLLLDTEMRAEFINRAFRRMLGYPDNLADGKPLFADIAEYTRARGVLRIKGVDPEEDIATRIAMLRSGDPTPVELRLADGRIVRVRCSVLPDGWRMLTYTDVTEEGRRAEELEALRSALDQVEYGVMLLDRDLRAQFINRAFRRMAAIPDELADSNPTFERIMRHGKDTSAYAVPDGDLEAFIARRLEVVREGTKGPIELRWSGGRVVRNQITVLPGGGRMLTYNDISDLAKAAEELERLATTDALTSLHNRRQFFTLAAREWNRVQRYDRPLALLMFDIDSFKSINDRFGHEVGDNVLVRVAAVCKEAKRDTDIVARIGGEEFAFLLPETDLPSAGLFAERLRAACAKVHVLPDRRDLAITVSVGVAEVDPGMRGIEDAMRAADAALYAAKRAGRNRVQWAPQQELAKSASAEAPVQHGIVDQHNVRKH
jgi:diguanylate cyclase (GGDEF)-like protein